MFFFFSGFLIENLAHKGVDFPKKQIIFFISKKKKSRYGESLHLTARISLRVVTYISKLVDINPDTSAGNDINKSTPFVSDDFLCHTWRLMFPGVPRYPFSFLKISF